MSRDDPVGRIFVICLKSLIIPMRLRLPAYPHAHASKHVHWETLKCAALVVLNYLFFPTQSCNCQRLWRHSQSSKKIGTPTRWLLWQMMMAIRSTSSFSNCFVSRVHVTKPKSLMHSSCQAFERDWVRCLVVISFTHQWHSSSSHC